MWSAHEAAQHWAEFFSDNARVMELPVGEILSNLVEKLADDGRTVGLDWNEAGVEPELNPSDFAERIRLELLGSFFDRCVVFGNIWILNDALGPALIPSATFSETSVLPCWSDDIGAEAHTRERWPDAVPTRIPVADFLTDTVNWLERQSYLVSPEYAGGAGALEIEATDFKFRLASRQMVSL